MQKIKDVESIFSQLKPLLRRYLEDQGTIFKGPLFTCPNRAAHNNGDTKPSAGFVPDTNEEIWNCFGCGVSSSIFGAYSYLEGKEVHGAAWFVALKELADRYSISYDLEPISAEEQIQVNVQQFLQELTKLAHNNLNSQQNGPAWDYLKERGWEECVRHFSVGYIEDTPKFQQFFKEQFGKFPEINQQISLLPSQLYNRLYFPIKHKYGAIFGIITRAIKETDETKYQKHFLKSLEKGGILFNLNKTYKTVYLVEGTSSVFTLHKHGVHNVVAMLGKVFTQQMYNALIKNGVNRVIFAFDGDEAGQGGLDNALTLTQDKSDIKILVKKLPLNKDPDDVVREFDIAYWKEIPEVSNYKYQLIKLKNETDDTLYENTKKSVFDILLSCKDSIIQDKMTKMFVEELNVSKTSLSEDLTKYKQKKGLISDVGIAEILNEEAALLRTIDTFEERAWKSGRLIGTPSGYPILDEALDGIQPGLILVGGKWNTGKSGFMQSVILNMLKDPTNFVLCFSIDDSVIGKTLPRFIANLSKIPINMVTKPIYGISQNATLSEAEKVVLKQTREEAIALMKTYSGRFGLKDSSDGYDTLFIEKQIKVYKTIAGERNLIVFVDLFNTVKWPRNVDRTEQETQLAGFFKHMSGLYSISIICSVESVKSFSKYESAESDVKGSSSLHSKSDLTMLLFSDFEVDPKSEMYFFDEKGITLPIVQLKVTKNKMSGFRGSLYYKFYRNWARFEECTPDEQELYQKRHI